MEEKEFNTAMEKIKSMRNAQDLRKISDSFHKYGKRYVEFAKAVDKSKLMKMSNDGLADYYLKYCKIWDEYTAFLWMIFYLADFYAEKGHEMITNKKNVSIGESEVLFSPVKRVGILELKDVLVKYKKKGITKLPKSDLSKITKEYEWIPCLDYINEPWKEKDLEEFYEHLEISEEGLDFNEVAKKIGLTDSEKSFFEQIREVAFLKDERDVYRRIGIFNSFSLFDEIARRLKITREESVYLIAEEIVAALKGNKVDVSEIRRRMSGFLLYRHKNGEIKISSDPKFVEEFIKENIFQESHSEIKGIIANKGYVKGYAKLVLLVSDLTKVKKGDIMVSITTHPDFVPAMQRASAFVTDEGGMMSHAAIVSREMKKPCIVGCKSGTRLIKDGDLIEVDADKGIVKIIKKGK